MITGLRIAETSRRQGEGGICTKNGSYSEKEKSQGGGGGSQGRCERRSEAFVEIKKKNFGWGRGGGVGLRGGGVQGGCELRSEAFVKIQKKTLGGGGGRVGRGTGWM